MTFAEQFQIALFFAAIALTVVGALRLFRWWFGEDRRVKALLAKAKTVKIDDAAEGALVKLVGKVRRADKLLDAPASGEPCLVWKLTVDRVLTRDQGTHRVLTRTDAADFWLEDDTGRALVKPVLPEVRLGERQLDFAGANECPASLRRLVDEHDRAAQGRDLIVSKGFTLRCHEGLVTEGETVAVLGCARWVVGESGGAADGYRASAQNRHLVLEDHSPVVLRISDDPVGL